LTPLSAVLGKSLLVESGLNPDLIGIAQGPGEVGTELIRYVDYVGFTGGTSTGRKVALAAAERLIPFGLELGGKNPMIVLKGAPLKEAADALLVGAFSNGGQTCISVERVYIEAGIFDEFARRVADGAAKLKVGWSNSWDVDVGSLIHSGHAAKVMNHVEQAVRDGAVVLAGGRRLPELGPCFVEPTVLTHVSPGSAITTEETFGPVISLQSVANADEAIALANNSPYGLNASIWAQHSSSASRVAREIESGTVAINATLLGYNTFDVPMGGMKQSGIGRRHAEYGILRYTQPQSIVESISTGGGFDNFVTKIRSERFAERLLRGLRWWRRVPGSR
jgi:succinate-semialdehyde dehydrogenase/glutarate-semialdehyde dehydrogenase